MASIKLYRDEVGEDQLPNVCMRCGRTADVQKRKAFSWCPGWVHVLILAGLLPWLLVMLIMTKRRTVYVPLCNEHKNHWLWRTLITLGGLGLIFVCFVATVVLLAKEEKGRGQGDAALGGFMCFGTLGLLLVVLIVAAILSSSSIRPTEITDRRITLAGVAPEFKEAIRDWDAQKLDVADDYDERFEGRRKSGRSEKYYDPERKRPRRSDDDDE
jgi:hypothetical protein